MGEENVGVNLVAEDESERGEDEDEDEDEDEGWWVGTVGVAEMPDQEEGTLDEMVESEPEREVRCASVKSSYRLEEEPKCPSGRRWVVESGIDSTLPCRGWSGNPAFPGEAEPQALREAASPQRDDSCSERGVVVLLHEHQAEETEEEAGDNHRSRVRGGPARCLVEADA
jgi:hypothetical protein